MRHSIKFLESGTRKSGDFPFYIYELNGKKGNMAINVHWHEEIEILYSDFDGIIELDTQSVNFERNSIIFINKEQLHKVYAFSDGKMYALVFDFSFLDFKNNDICQNEIIDKLKSKKFLFPKFTDTEKIKKIILNIIEAYFSNISGRELKIKCNLYELIFLFYTNNEFLISEEVNVEYNAAQLTYVKNAIMFMENNYAEPVTIEMLAKNANISKYYLLKIFKCITGKTPIIYLRELRIDISKFFLAQGYSITETALMSGFNNISYFIRYFKKETDVSPKKYQKRLALRKPTN